MISPYNLKNIRALLTKGFTAEELRRFCYDQSDFRSVYNQLAANTGKTEIIDQLLEHAEQKRLIDKLLAWAEEHNPARYREGQPYVEAVTSDSTLSTSNPNNPPKTALAPSKKESHPSSAKQIDQSLTAPVDFLIITPLEEERDALLNKLPNPKKLDPLTDDIYVYFESNLPLVSSNGSYRIMVMPLLGMGRVQAATATNDAIRRWNPRYVILVGIAGGVAANKVKLGDVLVPNEIVDYELQKQSATAVDIRWKVYNVSPRLLAAAQNFLDNNWSNLIQVKRPRRGQPKRHIGPIASGDKVIDFAQTLDKYRETWSKLIGVEMEAGGVAVSALQAAKQTEFFMIRGVSDLADGDKNTPQVKKWRSYACDVAASYTIALLKSEPVVLSSSGERLLTNQQLPPDLGEEHQSIGGISEQSQRTDKVIKRDATNLNEAPFQRWKKERAQSLERQLTILLRNQNHLEERKVYYGSQVPLEIINDLEYIREAIKRVTDELEILGVNLDESTPKTTSVVQPCLWLYENEELLEIVELANRGRKPITIGRSRDRDIKIDWKYHRVSGKHAYLVVETDSIRLFDNGSEFGTYVNSKPVDGKTGKALEDGDQIILGGLGRLPPGMAIGACYLVFKVGLYQ